MTFLTRAAGAAAVLALCSGIALADPAVIYDAGGKFDKGFNESAFNGMEQWKKETSGSYGEFEVQTDAQREQAIRRFAQKGNNPIVTVGFAQGTALEKVAKEFPDTHFVIIDFVVDLPNVESIVFKEHEGSFLVGALAAMASKTGKVGFVGGMDIPLIRRFQCGYDQGVKYEKKDATVLGNMTGTTPSAWNDPTKGGELAKSQFEQGADVVFAAAGATSLGVYQAAKDSGKLAIGVDSNQNYLHPGTMLTSMTKRVDVAVHGAVTAWKGGVTELGLKEAGVDWALDEHNKALVTDDMKAKIEAIKADIISGKIKVHDYVADNACPAS
jgi:basic membrane protein A